MLTPSDFNKHHGHFIQHHDDTDKVQKRFVIAACIWGTICLSITCGVIFVAIHFIQKFW